jgi:hypothetical protein
MKGDVGVGPRGAGDAGAMKKALRGGEKQSPDERHIKREKLFARTEAFPTFAFYRISG